MPRRRPAISIVLALLVAWAALTVRLDAPWLGHHEENGVWISAAVRNYTLYGAANLGLLPVTNPGPATPNTYRYYVHHPPLIVWSVALASAAFGFHEAAARWVAISATMIGIAAFYALARRLYSPRRAAWAALFYTFTPMMLYFGRLPNHECITLAVSMGLALTLVRWLERPTPHRWLALAALAALSAWTSWVAVLYVGALTLCGLWLARGHRRLALLAVGGVGLLALLALLAYYQWQWPGTLRSLAEVFTWRASNQAFRPGSEPFTLAGYIERQAVHLLMGLTPGLLVLGLAGILPAFRRDPRPARALLGALFLVGVGYLLVFRNASYIHDYYKIYLAPPLALTASAALLYGWERRRGSRWLRPALVALVLTGALSAAVLLVMLHQTGQQPYLLKTGASYTLPELAQSFAEHSTAQDIILSDMPYLTMTLEYYAFRNITWEVTPEQALILAEGESRPVLYAACTGQDDAPPPGMAGFPYQAQNGCVFVRLRGGSAAQDDAPPPGL